MTEISKEYAQALFELAKEQGSEKEFSQALHLILTELENAPEYAELLSSPNIPIEERRNLIGQAFAEQVPEYVLSFTQLLCERGRIREFKSCVREYEALYRTFESVSTARIISAAALTDSQKKALIEKLEKISGHTVTAEYEIDEALLGGLTVYIDDKVIDGSLRRKLKEVKEVIDK
jgi:F-type H+-transporting ATPase subunit delta